MLEGINMLTIEILKELIEDAEHQAVYIEMKRYGAFYRPRVVHMLDIGVKLRLFKIETIKYAHHSEITKVSLTDEYKKLLETIKKKVD